MFHSDTIDESLYTEMMEQIKKTNANQMRHLKRQRNVRKFWDYLRNGHFREAAGAISSYIKIKLNRRNQANTGKKDLPNQTAAPNYFSTERIAVYTVITGDYDDVLEPYCTPDNIDYFLFTDRNFDDSASAWKQQGIPSCLDGLSDAAKNRYLKMHPHILFPDYNFSIYVDGNIQIFTDLTEYINILGPEGIGTHLHPDRHCAYEELEAVVAFEKESIDNARRHALYLEETGMPHGYGLLECNVIAREHHNSVCIRIMEQWWQEYMEYAKRDQISLPHVLYMNGIRVDDVGVLGDNVRANPSFRVISHRLCCQPEDVG